MALYKYRIVKRVQRRIDIKSITSNAQSVRQPYSRMLAVVLLRVLCIVETDVITDGKKNTTSLLSAASDAGHRIVIRHNIALWLRLARNRRQLCLPYFVRFHPQCSRSGPKDAVFTNPL